jgi:hypothetical protein
MTRKNKNKDRRVIQVDQWHSGCSSTLFIIKPAADQAAINILAVSFNCLNILTSLCAYRVSVAGALTIFLPPFTFSPSLLYISDQEILNSISHFFVSVIMLLLLLVFFTKCSSMVLGNKSIVITD